MDKVVEFTGGAEDTYTHLALTVDYSVAPGLGVYAEYDSISSETGALTNDGSVILLGANVSQLLIRTDRQATPDEGRRGFPPPFFCPRPPPCLTTPRRDIHCRTGATTPADGRGTHRWN